MPLNVLIGAIFGSGIAIFGAGRPARAFLAHVRGRRANRR
jgi:hypothetical protein